jgi:hypothetical protein
MDAITQRLPGAGMIGSFIFFILVLVALYYLYQFLFSSNGLSGTTVINGIRDGRPDQPYITLANALPAIYEGGEYSVNAWIYINDYSIRRGLNKHVLSIGGSNFLTLAIYLGSYKNTLHVRVQTRVPAAGVAQASTAPSQSDGTADLSVQNLNNIFTTIQQDGGLLSDNRPCDVQGIDMQKWVQVTVTLNNKVCDVYLDGKLARSCILPSFYKVDKNNLTLRVSEYNGFGGFVSNVSAYNYALNPEQIWRLFMSGPSLSYSLLDYLKSLFDPKAIGALDYPKQNIIA